MSPSGTPAELHKLILHPQHTIPPDRYLIDEAYVRQLRDLLELEREHVNVEGRLSTLRLSEVRALWKSTSKLSFFRDTVGTVHGKSKSTHKESVSYL